MTSANGLTYKMRVFAALLLTALVLAVFGYCQISSVTLVVDSRVVPGWVIVEIDDSCPPARTQGSSVKYHINQYGYGCSSTSEPDGWLRYRVLTYDAQAGRIRRRWWPLSGVSRSSWSEGKCPGEQLSRVVLLQKFIGSEEDARTSKSVYELREELGLRCWSEASPEIRGAIERTRRQAAPIEGS